MRRCAHESGRTSGRSAAAGQSTRAGPRPPSGRVAPSPGRGSAPGPPSSRSPAGSATRRATAAEGRCRTPRAAGRQRDGKQGVPAELEEVPVQRHVLQGQDLREDRADAPLVLRRRGCPRPGRHGFGHAARSSFPCAVSGSASSPTQRPGPCRRANAGRRGRAGVRLARAHHVGGDAAAPRVGDHRRVAHAGEGGQHGSISPGSIRKPRILTWSSARSTNSRRPSAARTRSPVRYIRLRRRAGPRRTGGGLPGRLT